MVFSVTQTGSRASATKQQTVQEKKADNAESKKSLGEDYMISFR